MIIPSARSVEVGDKERIEAAAPSSNGVEKEEPGVIYTCKFPGCTRQYASTDGAPRTQTARDNCLTRAVCRQARAQVPRRLALTRAVGLNALRVLDSAKALPPFLLPSPMCALA